MTAPRVDKRLLLALGDPARQRVLTLLNERAATPSQISGELGMPEAEVVSHLDVLLENDAIEAVADLLAEVLERAMDIHAESVDRVARGESHGTIPAELVVMHFQRAMREARNSAGE